MQSTSAGRQDRDELELIASQFYEKFALFYFLTASRIVRFIVRVEAHHPYRSLGQVKHYISTERQHEGISIC